MLDLRTCYNWTLALCWGTLVPRVRGLPCGDCSPWFRGGIGSFVKRNGWAGDAISLLDSECLTTCILGPGGKVSPRKSMVQSACQHDVTSRVSNFQNGEQSVHRRDG